MSRLRLHLTKQETWKAVARLTLAEPVAQRQQSQTRPAFLRARCKSERLTLLDRLAVFLLPDAVAFTLATGRIVAPRRMGPADWHPSNLAVAKSPSHHETPSKSGSRKFELRVGSMVSANGP